MQSDSERERERERERANKPENVREKGVCTEFAFLKGRWLCADLAKFKHTRFFHGKLLYSHARLISVIKYLPYRSHLV